MTHFVYLTLMTCSALVFVFCCRRSAKISYDEGYRVGERVGRRPSAEKLASLQTSLKVSHYRVTQLEEQVSCLLEKINKPHLVHSA